MAENSWYDPRIVLRYKGEEEKGPWPSVWRPACLPALSPTPLPLFGPTPTDSPPSPPPPPQNPPGLFATAPLRKGELVLVFTGKVVPLPDLLAAGDRSMELSLQVNYNLSTACRAWEGG